MFNSELDSSISFKKEYSLSHILHAIINLKIKFPVQVSKYNKILDRTL